MWNQRRSFYAISGKRIFTRDFGCGYYRLFLSAQFPWGIRHQIARVEYVRGRVHRQFRYYWKPCVRGAWKKGSSCRTSFGSRAGIWGQKEADCAWMRRLVCPCADWKQSGFTALLHCALYRWGIAQQNRFEGQVLWDFWGIGAGLSRNLYLHLRGRKRFKL